MFSYFYFQNFWTNVTFCGFLPIAYEFDFLFRHCWYETSYAKSLLQRDALFCFQIIHSIETFFCVFQIVMEEFSLASIFSLHIFRIVPQPHSNFRTCFQDILHFKYSMYLSFTFKKRVFLEIWWHVIKWLGVAC